MSFPARLKASAQTRVQPGSRGYLDTAQQIGQGSGRGNMRLKLNSAGLYVASFLAIGVCGNTYASDPGAVWARGWTSHGAATAGLQFIGLGQGSEGLSGWFDYHNTGDGKKHRQLVVIAGTRTKAGKFFPHATLQVRKTMGSEWETIAKSASDGPVETISVSPDDHSGLLVVKLDPFRQYLHTHHRGRVIISTGDTAEFALEGLADPPREAQGSVP